MNGRAICAAAAGLMLTTAALPAAELALVRSFEIPGPSGLEYDPQLCALWIVNETREVVLVNLWGDEIRRFTSDLGRVDAVALEGDHLVLSDGNGSYQKVSREGVALAPAFRIPVGMMDSDGLFHDAETGDYWITDDSASQLIRARADGQVRQIVEGRQLSPQLMEPQGITRDPLSGNLLVVDDADASDSLFEFDANGRLLDVVPLAVAGMWDAEGISFQPDTSTLFVAYDESDTVAVFQYEPTLSPTFVALNEPEPGQCLISGFQSGPPPV